MRLNEKQQVKEENAVPMLILLTFFSAVLM